MNKWSNMTHNGVIEQSSYQFRQIGNYNSEQEEILWNYAHYIESDYWKSKIFQKNFLVVLQKYIDKNIKSVNEVVPFLKKCFAIQQKEKEQKKSLTKEEKEHLKKEKDLIKEKYGYAIINGEKQALGMYQLEPCGVFIGRGKSPLTGCWKERNYKSDVTINISKSAKVPEGNWKKVVENKNSMAIADYDIKLSNGHTIHKSVLFASNSIVKQNADKHKFDKAEKVLKHWTEIDKLIEKGILQNKDVAMVAWLVKNLGIRIGDEKDPEMESETFGASTLLGKHLKRIDSDSDNNGIYELSFLGKDSVPYTKKFLVPEKLDIVFKIKCETANKDRQLFPSIKSKDVSEFLSSVVDGITPKVFRTAWGSYLLAEELRKYKKANSEKDKVLFYNECNLSVAKQLNHQKAIGKNFNEQTKKMEDKIDSIKAEIVELKKDASKKEKLTKKKQQLKTLEDSLKFKKETKNYALGTSKTNYSNPKVVYSFCKDIDLNINKIYTKSLQERFSWAEDVNKNFYKNYRII